MSIASKLAKLETDITNAYSSIATKGGTIPQNKNTENLSNSITSIQTGGAELNIFIQNTQPSGYNGIWIADSTYVNYQIVEVADTNSLVANSINILKGNSFSTILVNDNIGLNYFFDRIFLTDNNNDIIYDIPTYYGKNNEWIDITTSLSYIEYVNRNIANFGRNPANSSVSCTVTNSYDKLFIVCTASSGDNENTAQAGAITLTTNKTCNITKLNEVSLYSQQGTSFSNAGRSAIYLVENVLESTTFTMTSYQQFSASKSIQIFTTLKEMIYVNNVIANLGNNPSTSSITYTNTNNYNKLVVVCTTSAGHNSGSAQANTITLVADKDCTITKLDETYMYSSRGSSYSNAGRSAIYLVENISKNTTFTMTSYEQYCVSKSMQILGY